MGRHAKTLAAVFADPLRTNIKWAAIEALFEHHGAQTFEAAGSRVRFVLNGVSATFHRPHPTPECHAKMIQSVRRFLTEAGITP